MENDNARQKWQDRLSKARNQYKTVLDKMSEYNRYYEGTRKSQDNPNKGAPKAVRLSANVRNICYELVESQVDSTIPMPRVDAIHEEDRELAKSIEAVLRHEVVEQNLAEMNDLQERTVPIGGGSFWHIEWNPKAGGHCVLGDVQVTELHPKQVIPQPGVYDVEKMDYIFVQISQTKEHIKDRYGIDVESCGETEPSIRGDDSAISDELVTQNIAYYRNKQGGIGMFSWVDDVTLVDMEDFQARRLEKCVSCGRVRDGDVCECGGTKFEEQPVYFDEANIPYYNPGRYPVILRRNVRKADSFLGSSDIAAIMDQQDAVKKFGDKISEKILKGGSFVTLPKGVRVETTDKEFKTVYLDNPAQKAQIGVINVQPDVSKEIQALELNYQWAKSTLGITDSFQGKYDSSATSGTAKQFAANQSAGRLQSKREQKNQAFARLYEMIFRYLLAYSDQPIPYSVKQPDGSRIYSHFNRMDFLKQDAAGQQYWNDEFIFTVDSSANLATTRSMLWDQLDTMYQAGAFGVIGQSQTNLLLWTMLADSGYPYAENIKAMIESQIQQEVSMNALSEMQTGNENEQPV